jgi:galactoside O-acetyltransferase
MQNLHSSFLSQQELMKLGLKQCGRNVKISRYAHFYSPENIRIGNNVRIDDFCIISAGSQIDIGDYVHIACYTSLIGEGKIVIEDFCSISGRVSIYSSSDDFMGLAMTNPMVPKEYTRVNSLPVILRKHCIIGCGTIILPGVELGIGVSIGALSLVNSNCEEETIYAGNPLKIIGKRIQRYHKLEAIFLNKLS